MHYTDNMDANAGNGAVSANSSSDFVSVATSIADPPWNACLVLMPVALRLGAKAIQVGKPIPIRSRRRSELPD